MGRSRVLPCSDREDAVKFLTIVEFASYEEAMKNSADPATSQFAEQMGELCDGPPANLDVLDEQNRWQTIFGAVETNDTGTSQVTYVAAVTGPRTISATYLPTVLGDPVTGTANFDVAEAVSQYIPPQPRALVGVGNTLVVTLFGLVIIVFIILIAQVVRVRRACRPVAKRSAEHVPAT